MTSPDAPRHQEPLADPEEHLPPHHAPLPGLYDPHKKAIPTAAFERAQASPEFAELKKRFRNFAFPMTAAFLVWYFAYVLLSVFARGFMSIPAIGNLNIGMVMGLAQFVTTFLITWLYIRHMNRNIDPIASKLRAHLEEASK